MRRILNIILIFCFNPFVKGISLRIDGLIDLGPNWGYEYRILTPNEGTGDHKIARYGNHYNNPAVDAPKDEYNIDSESASVSEKPEPKREKISLHTTTQSTTTTTTPKPNTWSSESEDRSSSLDSWEKTTKKEGTRFDMYDFTTTRKSKKKTTPFGSSELGNKERKHKDKSKLVNEDAISYVEDTNRNEYVSIQREKGTPSTIEKFSDWNNAKTKESSPTSVSVTETTTVTTIRTAEIYSDPHKVKDDAKINEFTKHIFKQTLEVIDVLKKQTSEYQIKKEIDVLAKNYESKFKEFLRDTSNQKIKTRLGTQKVILNTIDMSNRILKRLVNHMIGDMDKKGFLRHSVGTVNIFQGEIDKEQTLELNHACKKFGICRTGSGFPTFMTDIISLILYTDGRKFKHCIDALTEVVKSADFNRYLERHTEKKLKESMERIEQLNPTYMRTRFMIVKNIITHKNKPVIVNNNAARGRVNATLALLEIIDLLDQNTPQNEANVLEWNDMLRSLKEFADNKREDVQDIMEILIKHLKKTLKSLDETSLKIVNNNLDIILGKWS